MLFSFTSTEAYTTHPRQADNYQSGQHVRPKSIGLLQCCVGRAAEVNYCSIAARPECRRETNMWPRSTWSRDTGTIWAALASCRATCDIQTVCFYAPHSYWAMFIILIRSSHVNLQHRISFPTSFRKQSTLRATSNPSQVRRAEFYVCGPCSLELSPHITSWNNEL